MGVQITNGMTQWYHIAMSLGVRIKNGMTQWYHIAMSLELHFVTFNELTNILFLW